MDAAFRKGVKWLGIAWFLLVLLASSAFGLVLRAIEAPWWAWAVLAVVVVTMLGAFGVVHFYVWLRIVAVREAVEVAGAVERALRGKRE